MPAVGEIAPDFELLNDEGKPTRLSNYRGKKVVLYFYPADFTPGCEMQSCQFRDATPQFAAHNAIVLGISPDGVESHRKFREAHNLPFNLLVDADLSLTKAWGAYGEKSLPGGKTTVGLVRSHFVIDETGRIVDVQTPVAASKSMQLALDVVSGEKPAQ